MSVNKSHLGLKLAAEMERLGLKPPDVATLFDVKVPSVYDWIRHGRMHKRHYPALVAMSDRSIEWWLGMPETKPDNSPQTPAHKAAEEPAKYKVSQKKHAELIELFDALPATEQNELLTELRKKKRHYAALLDELLHRTHQ